MLKTPFVEIFTFFSRPFGFVEKRLDMVNFKIMTSQTGQQIIIMHILPNISTSKSNQAIKLGQLINYGKRNILLQKSCRK